MIVRGKGDEGEVGGDLLVGICGALRQFFHHKVIYVGIGLGGMFTYVIKNIYVSALLGLKNSNQLLSWRVPKDRLFSGRCC